MRSARLVGGAALIAAALLHTLPLRAQSEFDRPLAPRSALPGAGDPRGALDRTRADEGSILDQLAVIDQELGRALTAMVDLQARAEALEQARAQHALDVQTADEQLAVLRVAARDRLRGLYRLHRQGVARVIFGAQDPIELRRRGRYLLALVRADADQLQAFTSVAASRRTAMQAVEKDIEQIGHFKAELAAHEETLRVQRQDRMGLLRQIRSERELALRALAEYGAARGDLDQRLGAMPPAPPMAATEEDGSWVRPAAIDPVTASAQPIGSFRDTFGELPWPVHGRVIHRFGPYTDPLSGRPMTSQGLDIAAEHGEPVRAVFPGRVQMAEYVRGFGQTVVLEHGAYVTLYAHLGSVRVTRGQSLRAGEVVGLVGNTGLTDEEGYMLTFQVRYNNSPQDPILWLERR